MTMLDWQRTGGHARVLIVVTGHSQLGDSGIESGLWLSELAHPYFMLHDSGVKVDIASPAGGKLVIDPHGRDEKDPDNRRFLGDDELLAMVEDMPALATLDFSAYQGIFFAGGHGAMWDFPNHSAVQMAVTEIYQAGHIVAAVSQGVAALVNVTLPNGKYLVEGREVTGYTREEQCDVKLQDVEPFSLQDLLCERGARFSERPAWEENVVVDEPLITGQNPASGKFAGIAMVRHLRSGSTP
jgi:putative intracellular protease/amidase